VLENTLDSKQHVRCLVCLYFTFLSEVILRAHARFMRYEILETTTLNTRERFNLILSKYRDVAVGFIHNRIKVSRMSLRRSNDNNHMYFATRDFGNYGDNFSMTARHLSPVSHHLRRHGFVEELLHAPGLGGVDERCNDA